MEFFVVNTVKAIRRMTSRKHKDLREACDGVNAAVAERQKLAAENGGTKVRDDDDADKYFEPFRLACNCKVAKITSKSLDCLQKLMAYGYLKGRRLVTDRDDSGQPRQRPLVALIVETICSCKTSTDENVQLQVIKALLTAVTCNHCEVHETSLLKAVQACYHIHLESRSAVNRTTAKGTLRQMVNIVFERMEAHDKRQQAKEENAYKAALVRSASEKFGGETKHESGTAGTAAATVATAAVAAASPTTALPTRVVKHANQDSSPPPPPSKGRRGIVPPPAGGNTPPSTSDIWKTRKRLWKTSEEFRRQVRGRSGPNMYPHVYMCLQYSTPIHDVTDWDLDEQEEQRRVRRAQLGPGSSAALEDPFASVLHRDAFLLFRSLCRLSMKVNPAAANQSTRGGDSKALDSKVLALELILGVLEASGHSFRSGDKFIFAIKNHLCDSLIQNISLLGDTVVVTLSLRIFVALITHFKDNLKSEIEVFISSMFLRILESDDSVFEHRMKVLEVFARLCQDSYTVVELFINYDCSDEISSESGVFERIVGAMSKISQMPCDGDPNSPSVQRSKHMRLLALRSLVSLTKCMVEFTDVQPPSRNSSMDGGGGGSSNNSNNSNNTTLSETKLAEIAEEEDTKHLLNDLDAISVASEDAASGTSNPNEGDTTTTTNNHNSIGGLGSLVDSVDAFDKKQRVKQELENGITHFNTKPKNGISYLVYSGIIEPICTTEDPTGQIALKSALEKGPGQRPRLQGNPPSIADFLLKYTEGKIALDKGQIGDFMGEGSQYNVDILHSYTELLEFTGMEIDDGIRYFLKEFRLPGEAQKVDRMMEKFAQVYADQNPGIFDSPETAFVLSFSIIMLNTDLHNPNIKEDRKMTKDGFIRNNRGIASGRDLPADYLMGIFDRIQANQISLKEDDMLRMAAAKQRNTAGTVKAKRLAMQADMQKEAVDRLHSKRRIVNNSDREPGAWMNNMYFTMTDVLSSRNADYVRPMFGLLWSPSLTVYDLLLRTAWNDDKVVDLCLQGLRFGIRVSGVFKMENERKEYVTTLSNFACLNHSPDSYMQRINVESVKVVLSVAMSEGEHLGTSWSDVLNVVSEVARLFIIAETGGRNREDQNLFKSPAVEQRRRSLGNGDGYTTKNSSNGSMMNSPASIFNNSRSKAAAAARKLEEQRIRRKEVEIRNAQLIASSINFQELERIFTSSTGLGQGAIVDFMECLSNVAKFELIGEIVSGENGESSSTSNQSSGQAEPRVFSLQKLVEMADYNMNIRPRVVWARLWSHISSLFEDVGAHPNMLIAMYAIDSLKQLGVKFLERTELSHFQFQRVFMQPFDKIMNKNPNQEIRELVLSVINNIIQLRHSNIMSGWKVIFSVYSAAAADQSAALNTSSFNAMAKLIEEHWELVYPNFVDIINCFASFAKNMHHEKTSLSAIAQILRLTDKLVQGTNDIRCDEHGALLSLAQQQEAINDSSGANGESTALSTALSTASSEAETKQEHRFTDSADHSRVWFPILTCLANLVVDERAAVRKAALYGLFQILNNQGHAFSPSLWELIFKGVLFPIFDDVRHSEVVLTERLDPETNRFIKAWLDTTCQDALNMLVGLFETPERYSTLSFLLTDVMKLVRSCIVHPSKLLARKGVVCLQQLLVESGRLFPENVWDQVCTNMVSSIVVVVIL